MITVHTWRQRTWFLFCHCRCTEFLKPVMMMSPIVSSNTYYHGIHFWWKEMSSFSSNVNETWVLTYLAYNVDSALNWWSEHTHMTARHVLREGALSLCVRVRRLVRLCDAQLHIQNRNITFKFWRWIRAAASIAFILCRLSFDKGTF